MLSFYFIVWCLFDKLSSATIDLTSATAGTDLDYADFALQRTPDGGAYVVNITFIEDALTVPMKLELSSAETWVNTYTTYCWNLGNLFDRISGSCGVVSGGSPSTDTPTPAYLYYNSDETYMYGKRAAEDISLGDYQVYGQDLVLADQNWIQPDEISAGVLGLAYPEALTSSLSSLLSPSQDPSAESEPAALISSSSFLANLFHQNNNTASDQITPIIGLAISRDASGVNNAGYLTIGNWANPLNPDVNITNEAILGFPLSVSNYSGTSQIYNDTSMQYTLLVTGLTSHNATFDLVAILNNNTNTSYFPQTFYLSTSETVISLPPPLAALINGMFDPPGISAGDNESYYVHCDALVPDFGLKFGNTTFVINPQDLKRHSSNSLCISTITADLNGHYVLGDVFLRNVLLVLDFESKELILASRPYYAS